VATFDRTFDYRKLNIGFQAIRRGAHFIATNPDRTCPVEGGEILDCAAVIAALEVVTQKSVEVIVGKPSPITVQVALESGMKAALVMTGVTDAKTLEASPVRPDYILQSIADLEALL
jgi:ribonucleotide monophosphatase NagD (HAD superfamily)